MSGEKQLFPIALKSFQEFSRSSSTSIWNFSFAHHWLSTKYTTEVLLQQKIY